MFNTLNVNLERLLHYVPNVHASHENENQDLAPSPNTNREEDVVDHLVQLFIRFAGASYAWYGNIRSRIVGDR